MKKIIFKTTLILFVYITSNAQSNLEFNRVIKDKYVYYNATPVNSSLIVPAGKVLKITSATVSPCPLLINGAPNQTTAFIDGQVVAYSYYEQSNIYQAIMRETIIIPLPLWLPSGTYQIATSSSSYGTFSFSGIEFNIVP